MQRERFIVACHPAFKRRVSMTTAPAPCCRLKAGLPSKQPANCGARSRRHWGRMCVLAFWIIATCHLAAAQSAFNAALDRATIAAGETATLTLTFEGKAPNIPPSIPAVPNLDFAYAGQSSQFTIVNGQASSSLTYSYRVNGSQPGEYVIPAIEVVVEGRKLASHPLRLTVLKADQSTNPTAPRAAFFRLIVPKEQLYVGEVIPVELQLFVSNPHDLQMPQLKSEGFTLGAMTQTGRSQAQAGNAVYTVFSFKIAATAAKTGALKIGPAECNVVLRFRRPRDPNDPFGDFFGGGVELRQATVRSDIISIQSLPLPTENQPPDFGGAVGDFSIAVTAGPTNVVVGDPITVTVQVAGEGALDGVGLPPADWRDFNVYQPNTKVEPTDPLGTRGVKTFEQVVIPQNSELKQLPPISLSFFDPKQKKYRTVLHPAIPITVRPNPQATPQPSISAPAGAAPEEPPTVRDIVHIKAQLGAINSAGRPLVQQTWFLALQAVPLAAWLTALIWRKRRDHLARNPRLRRRIQVRNSIKAGLAELEQHAAAHEPEPFFATVFRLLQEQLGERLDLPASAITESVIDEHLHQRAAPDDLRAELHALFQLCNQARYAPQFSVQELISLVPRVASTLKQLSELSDEPALSRS